MALSRTGKVSRSLDRQRRIPKNSLYRWNNWCTCPRGGSDFNFCPRRVKSGRGTTREKKFPRRRRQRFDQCRYARQIVDISRRTYLSVTFNGNFEYVTRVTFLRGRRRLYAHLIFYTGCTAGRVIESASALFTKGQPRDRVLGPRGLNTWGLGSEYYRILGCTVLIVAFSWDIQGY